MGVACASTAAEDDSTTATVATSDESPSADNKSAIAEDPTPEPTPTTELSLQWIEVARFGGESITNTDTFSIPSRKWRIRWSTSPGRLGELNFQIYVYRESGELIDVAANAIGDASGSTVIRGSGDFYLTINTLQPYGIFVEEERLAPPKTPTPTPEPTATPRSIPSDVVRGEIYQLRVAADRGSIYYTWNQILPAQLDSYQPQRNLTTGERLAGLRIPPVVNCVLLPRTAPPTVGLTWMKDGPPVLSTQELVGIGVFKTDLECLEAIGQFEATVDGEKVVVWIPLMDLYIGAQ